VNWSGAVLLSLISQRHGKITRTGYQLKYSDFDITKIRAFQRSNLNP